MKTSSHSILTVANKKPSHAWLDSTSYLNTYNFIRIRMRTVSKWVLTVSDSWGAGLPARPLTAGDAGFSAGAGGGLGGGVIRDVTKPGRWWTRPTARCRERK